MPEHHHDHQHHGDGNHGDLSEIEARVLALESLLVEKGLVTSQAVDEYVYRYEHDVGPMLGAQVVAKAWTDPEFKARLLADPTAAVSALGIKTADLQLAVVENGPGVHNMVVCTLCSCYPWFLLGLPPVWYKSAPYRSRAVIEPRSVLAEFGVVLPEDTEVRVWDSTADLRYMVLPERPDGTEGMDEAELAKLVTRDAMIGTGLVTTPAGARAS